MVTFSIGDIVQFGYHKLLLGVVESLPPDPAFVAQVERQNGMLDAVDDSYLVLCGKGGKEHDHLHECELFEPDVPVPRSMTALQKEVLAGNWRTPSPVLVQTCGEIMTRLLNNPRKKRQRY
jgi:hypothetical protein